MKLGVFTVLLAQKPLNEALDYLQKLGVQAVELGSGGYSNPVHCNPAELLAKPGAAEELRRMVADHGMEISALSCHGNCVHPVPEVAAKYQASFEDTIKLAERLGLDRIVTFSGCPGGAKGDASPNWITCPWPDDFSDSLRYQWEDVLIPYWEKAVAYANDHGVKRIALEMHPGFCVYNPETCLKLRAAVGDTIGANFDPSHLFWQGVDCGAAIRYLGDALYYFHAKDTRIDPINTGRFGVLDTKHYSDEINRAWVFRSLGYGHDLGVWKDMVSNLRMIGYDDVLSIEHEDSLMSVNEGLTKAINLLKEVITFEQTGGMWWA